MPTYDYKCQNCEHEFESFQPITAKPFRKCPECGKMKLNRLIGTGAGIIFKGSGFYQTDYRSDSYNKAATKERDAGKSKSSEKKSKDKKTTPKASDSVKSKPKKKS